MKELVEIEEKNLHAICGIYPFEMLSSNGKPLLGLGVDHIEIFGINDTTPEESSYYIFLKRSWLFKIGFALIWFGFRNLIRNIFIRGNNNAES